MPVHSFSAAMQPVRLAICRCFYLTGIYWRHRQVHVGNLIDQYGAQSQSGQRFSKVAADGEWLSGDKPSKEVLFHLALYRNNPRCKAVVHLHSTWSTALSCLQGLDSSNVIRPFTPYVVMRMEMSRWCLITDRAINASHMGSGGTGSRQSGFLLANHGPVVCGESLQEAANNMEELEETAKLIFFFILGDRPIRYLTAGEIAELRS